MIENNTKIISFIIFTFKSCKSYITLYDVFVLIKKCYKKKAIKKYI